MKGLSTACSSFDGKVQSQKLTVTRKGVSFLSRLIPNKKREATADDSTEDPSELGDGRPEGMDAELFYQPIDNMGFSPRHPQPPGYIKVRSRNKKEKFFDRLFLAQELRGSSATKRKRKGSSATNSGARRPSIEGNTGAIWAMEFSKDGKYLAAGGQDKVVRVWSVISTMAERRAHEKEEDMEGAQDEHMRLSAPVFRKKPVREYEGHTASVLDISWSKVSMKTSLPRLANADWRRTISSYLRQWTRRSAYGMSAEPNVSVRSNIATS